MGRLNNEEKYEILFMNKVQGISPYQIHKQTGRSRNAISNVLENDNDIFDGIPIEERIRESILKSYEKYSIDIDETIGTINKVLRDQVTRLANKEWLTYTDINTLINIDKQIRGHQSKSLDSSEKINYNKKNIELKKQELQEDTSTQDFMDGFTNMLKDMKDGS